jgi:glycosyltransferase 2 family protein
MKLLIKIFVSFGMLGLAMRLIDMTELKQSILSIPLSTLVVVVFIFFFGQLLSSYKWWLLARCGGLEASWPLAIKAYFLGMFVNCFGLGTIGGDLARAFVLGSGSKQKATALASVFADRVHGLTVLAAIAAVSMAFFGRQHIGSEYLVMLSVCIIAIVIGWYFGPGIALAVLPKGGALHLKMQEITRVFPRNPATIGYISLISLLFHLLQISLHQVMAAGFGIQIPWHLLLVTIPIINILSSLPISWNGLGVRENGYIFFLAPPLLSREQAIAFGAMWLFAMAISSAIGGLVLVFSKDLNWRVRERTSGQAPAEFRLQVQRQSSRHAASTE